MSSYYIYKDHVVSLIGEVAVHNMPGTPEAHFLFRSASGYLTMGMNDVERFMQPVANRKEIELVDNDRKAKSIVLTLSLVFGDVSRWANKRRHRNVVRARQLYFWAMSNATSVTLEAIGRSLPASYDHATIIHGRNAIEREIECGVQDIVEVATEIAKAMELLGCDKLTNRINALTQKAKIARMNLKQNREVLA